MIRTLCFVCIAFTISSPALAIAQDWPAVFDPIEVLPLKLTMAPADWQTIQEDETFDIEVPAMFWTGDEEPILVSVRRKSADPIRNGTSFTKVSLKIDINEYVSGQEWHGLRKLSLENGDDQDVVSEGVAWYLHRLAAGPEGYGYLPGLAAWVTVSINGVQTGVYVNVEQPDKKYMQNRKTYVTDQTWLYKVSDPYSSDLKVGGPEDSPTYADLCYLPFNDDCAVPDEDSIVSDLASFVNMQGFLTLGALCQFGAGGDAMFTNGKNFYYADFTFGLDRRYYPWDLDSHLSGGGANFDIYSGGSLYGDLLAIPEIRSQYSTIMNDLICGGLNEQTIIEFLDAAEPILTPYLEADANSQLEESVSKKFANLRNWFAQRFQSVTSQIENYEPCSSIPADLNGDMVVNAADLGLLLGGWGVGSSTGDLNGDGNTDSADLGLLLGAWTG